MGVSGRGALGAVLLAAGLLAPRPGAAQQPSPSLYDRLGGVYPIAVVVDEFINRLLVNQVLNANPAIAAARARVPAPGLKYHVTALVCQATGGGCGYTGRSMKQAHAHLHITDREWQEMVRVFRGVLDHFQVPAKEQQELVAIVESTKGDIVVAGR
jgi:hemoglobin